MIKNKPLVSTKENHSSGYHGNITYRLDCLRHAYLLPEWSFKELIVQWRDVYKSLGYLFIWQSYDYLKDLGEEAEM